MSEGANHCGLLHPDHAERVLVEVREERGRQDARWGEQNHSPSLWLAILAEEVGELAQAVLAHELGAEEHKSRQEGMKAEATQVAAVATAFLEYLIRLETAAESTSRDRGCDI